MPNPREPKLQSDLLSDSFFFCGLVGDPHPTTCDANWPKVEFGRFKVQRGRYDAGVSDVTEVFCMSELSTGRKGEGVEKEMGSLTANQIGLHPA